MSQRVRIVVLFLLVSASIPAAADPHDTPDGDPRPNVLMIWVDDLRPEINSFGARGMHTPHFDRLAARSVSFDRAYCNIPVCGASRASVMTGMRGTPTRFVGYRGNAQKEAPDAVALNTLFQRAGYATAYDGKIYHRPEDSAAGWDRADRWDHWSGFNDPDNEAKFAAAQRLDPKRLGPATEAVDVDDAQTWDGKVARSAVKKIEAMAGGPKSFFIATGFYKPHLPFTAPKRYWDLYPDDEVVLPDNLHQRPEADHRAFTNWDELRAYMGMPSQGPLTDAQARHLIRGYRACVSFIDAQLGLVLDALDASGEQDHTVVLLLGDHGWNLGEHGMWCKHCTFETSMRTPLMLAAPMLAGFMPGTRSASLVEFVDIYPTLMALTGVQAPADQLVGRSLRPLLIDPSASVRDIAVGRWKGADTIRDDRYRYRYTVFRSDQGRGRVEAEMLYDHQVDPHENVNLMQVPGHEAIAAELRGRLMAAIKDD